MITANVKLTFYERFDLQFDSNGNIKRSTWEWEGPRNGIAAISGRLLLGSEEEKKHLPIGAVIKCGPYDLEVFEEDILRNTFYLIRRDSRTAKLRAITLYKLSDWFDLAYRRLILAIAIRGIAQRIKNLWSS